MLEERKKKCRVGRVFRGVFAAVKWLFVVILALLFVWGIYYHGPWKVLTLIGVILATLTIMPKPVRKWVWGCFGVIVIVLIVWVFLPDDNEGWKRYTFDEELAQLRARYAVEDEENAAVIYNQMLETYDANDFAPEFLDNELECLTWLQPWSSEDYRQMAEWVKSNEKTTAALMHAVAKEKCYFQIYAEPISTHAMDRLGPMGRWATFLVRAGFNDLGDFRNGQALDKFLATLQIGNHLYQQQSMLYHLVGFGIEGRAIAGLNYYIVNSEIENEQLERIEEAIQGIGFDWATSFPGILDYDKLHVKNTLALCYEVNESGKTRFARNMDSVVPPEFRKTLGYWQKKYMKSMAVLYWFDLPNTPQQAGELIEKKCKDTYKMALPDYQWPNNVPEYRLPFYYFYYGFSWLFWEPSEFLYHQVHDLYLQLLAKRYSSRIMIALRRYKNEHNQWPGSLEDIKTSAPSEIFIDPINSGDYVYKLTGENFTLYSKGKNGIDEEGVRNTMHDPNEPKWPTTKEDDILFWPRKQ